MSSFFSFSCDVGESQTQLLASASHPAQTSRIKSQRCLTTHAPLLPRTTPPSMSNPTLAEIHTTKVRLVQSKLLLLRITELTTPKPPDPSHIPNHHVVIYNNLVHTLQTTLRALSTFCKTPSSALSTHLEIHTRCTVFLLVYTLHLIARHPGTEKAFTVHRVTAFLHTQSRDKQYRHQFMTAVKLCTREMLCWFDYAALNVFWSGGNAVEQRLSFIDELLPKIVCQRDGPCCTICYSEYRPGCIVRQFSGCSHLFHAECLDRWLLGRQETCPLCREPLNPLLILTSNIRKLTAYTKSLNPLQPIPVKRN